MKSNILTRTVEPAGRVMSNCFACGRPLDHLRLLPNHNPDPISEEDRCASRPRKYDHLRCVYAAGHDCAHTARVAGTGRHHWRDADAVQLDGERKRP